MTTLRPQSAEQDSRVFQLTMQQGKMPGACWVVTDTPMFIGRSRTAHIVVEDSTVSRRQCSIQRVGDAVRLQDMGSSNPCLVNGTPRSEATLQPGDRLTVGDSLFLVSLLQEQGARITPTPAGRDTLRLSESENPLLLSDPGDTHFQILPKTAREYAHLFQLSLDCAECRSAESIVDTALRHIADTLAPASAWILYGLEGHRAVVAAKDEGPAPYPETLIQAAMEEQRSRAALDTKEADGRTWSAMAAPLLLHGRVLGAVAVVSSTELHAYQRHDLEFFSAYAHVITPYLRAVEERDRLRADLERLSLRAARETQLVGKSKAIHDLRRTLRQAAGATDLHVLLLGETGTGKELAAELLHQLSERREKKFVALNCSAIPDELFESEFFGHSRGAYTGAAGKKEGLVSVADGGTLFLDEVSELSPANQAKLLRFSESGVYRTLGELTEKHADVRIVAATNKELPDDGFRQDLFHRLSGYVVRLPALRDRPSDIPLLAKHFLHIYAPDEGAENDLSEEVIDWMKRQPWPGNVRELKQCIHRATSIARGRRIRPEDLERGSGTIEQTESTTTLTMQELERKHIAATLKRFGGNVRLAAEAIGMPQSTMYKRMHEYDLKD